MTEEFMLKITDDRHCDNYIDDKSQPECMRKFLKHSRAPAHGALLGTPRPLLFATHGENRVKVVFASRG